MNTQKTHERFWDAMRARFGLRWIQEYGETISDAWKQLLNRYTPDNIRSALELMATQKLQHPPTLPIVEGLLEKAAGKSDAESAQNWQRGYWRSCIVYECIKWARATGVIQHQDEFEAYLIQHKATLGASLRQLLDELCDMENRNGGQRTIGLIVHAHHTTENIFRAHRAPFRLEAA